jgi:hypothetical protein
MIRTINKAAFGRLTRPVEKNSGEHDPRRTRGGL